MEVTEIITAGSKYGLLGIVTLVLLAIVYLVIKKFLEIIANFVNQIAGAQVKVATSVSDLSQNSIKNTEILLKVSEKLEKLATEEVATKNHKELKELLHSLSEQINKVVYNNK